MGRQLNREAQPGKQADRAESKQFKLMFKSKLNTF